MGEVTLGSGRMEADFQSRDCGSGDRQVEKTS